MKDFNSKTHDLSLDEIVVPVQRMFPNCRKYKKCCTEDMNFWLTLEELKHLWKPKKQPFRTLTVKSDLGKAPEGFEGW